MAKHAQRLVEIAERDDEIALLGEKVEVLQAALAHSEAARSAEKAHWAEDVARLTLLHADAVHKWRQVCMPCVCVRVCV
jgi:uncharacterized small protein (DUF1192 family)